MPAYHSSMNGGEHEVACGCAVLPLKTTTRGPAPLLADSTPPPTHLIPDQAPLPCPRRSRPRSPPAPRPPPPPLALGALSPSHPSSQRAQLRSLGSTPSIAGEDDIVDEVLGYFKANVLFKHFEVKGAADRVLIYLTLYITQCLQKLEKCPSPIEGLKALTAMAHETFRIPGDPGFALGSFFPAPASSQEAGQAPPLPPPP